MASASSGLRHPASASCLGRHARLAGRCPNNSSLFPPLAAVVVVAAEELLIIRAKSDSLRAARLCIFTGGVVKANGSCHACFLRKQSRGGRTSSPSQSPSVTALPKGEPLAWRYSFRLNCKVCGFARASPFGRGGIASAMTERASPLPGSVFRPKSHVLGRKSQTIKQSAQKGGAKFGGDAFDRSWKNVFEKQNDELKRAIATK